MARSRQSAPVAGEMFDGVGADGKKRRSKKAPTPREWVDDKAEAWLLTTVRRRNGTFAGALYRPVSVARAIGWWAGRLDREFAGFPTEAAIEAEARRVIVRTYGQADGGLETLRKGQ